LTISARSARISSVVAMLWFLLSVVTSGGCGCSRTFRVWVTAR
jgi:hypothetical protein